MKPPNLNPCCMDIHENCSSSLWIYILPILHLLSLLQIQKLCKGPVVHILTECSFLEVVAEGNEEPAGNQTYGQVKTWTSWLTMWNGFSGTFLSRPSLFHPFCSICFAQRWARTATISGHGARTMFVRHKNPSCWCIQGNFWTHSSMSKATARFRGPQQTSC